jgi:purine nucleosidase
VVDVHAADHHDARHDETLCAYTISSVSVGTPRPVVIDTDGGVDDAAALWWAVTDPSLDVRAISIVWGNVDVDIARGSVLTVLEAAGRLDIPVALGLAVPDGPVPPLRRATFIHGDDGLGNTGRPVPDVPPHPLDGPTLLAETILEHPGAVELITLGPLTNVAAALAAHPELAAATRRITIMGGVIGGHGNAMPTGEANIAHDPGAARAVLTAPWAEPPLLVGLDVTHRATLTDEEFALLAEHRTAAAAFLDEPLRFYRTAGDAFTRPDCPCHDLLAVLAVACPDVITDAPVLPVAVDCGEGPAWGSTIVDLRAERSAGSVTAHGPDLGFSPCRVAIGVDVEAFRRLVQSLFSKERLGS